MSDKIELKPCPFCGGEAVFTDNYYGDGTGCCVICVSCAAGSCIVSGASPKEKLKEEAITSWNRRVNND